MLPICLRWLPYEGGFYFFRIEFGRTRKSCLLSWERFNRGRLICSSLSDVPWKGALSVVPEPPSSPPKRSFAQRACLGGPYCLQLLCALPRRKVSFLFSNGKSIARGRFPREPHYSHSWLSPQREIFTYFCKPYYSRIW